MNSIFSYIDYRKFLEDFYTEKKRTTKCFSYRYFSRRAKLTSPVFLKLVIEGKRNLTERTIRSFAKALDLNERESLYFRHLVLFDQSGDALHKQEHYSVMVSMMGLVNEKVLNSNQSEYLSRWYMPVVRELLCLADFDDNHSLLAQTVVPPITPIEAGRAVNLLVELNLIAPKADGGYCAVSSAWRGTGKIGAKTLRDFNREMARKGIEAIDRFPISSRHASSVTIGISPASYKLLEAELRAFKDRVVAIAHRDEHSSQVYQLNLQLFPVSKDIADVPPYKDTQ